MRGASDKGIAAAAGRDMTRAAVKTQVKVKTKEKVIIDQLIIEITRRCNMACDHCCRGEAQNMNIRHKDITAFLEQVDEVYSLTFSGGEPTLNVPSIEFTLAEMKRLNVPLLGFYIATNGKKVGEDFILACLRLYAYVEECGGETNPREGSCIVDLSNDQWHQNEDAYDGGLLKGLAFFKKKFKDDGEFYEPREEGRYAQRKGRGPIMLDSLGLELDDNYVRTEFEVYLNARGYIINGCDWSYETQESRDAIRLCHAADFREYIRGLAAEQRKENDHEQ